MDRSRIHELHFITDLANVASILDHGILSCREVRRRGIPHVTIAKEDLRNQQRDKRIWDTRTGRARSLLEYANLYFHARNAMLFERLINQQGGSGGDRGSSGRAGPRRRPGRRPQRGRLRQLPAARAGHSPVGRQGGVRSQLGGLGRQAATPGRGAGAQTGPARVHPARLPA